MARDQKFKGKIVGQCFDGTSLRYLYQVVWSGGGRQPKESFADLHGAIDVRIVELLILERR